VSSVSVIIPAYNQPRMLAEALGGVLAQTLAPAEVIVVDDCSERPLEQTTEVPAGLSVRFVRNARNLGPGGSVVRGIREARGDLLSTLNHDDVWEPAFLQRLSGALAQHPEACFAFCDHGVMLADGQHDERRSREQSARFGRLALSSGLLTGERLYRAALLEKAVAASSFTLVRRAALDLELIAAGADTWDYCVAVGACRAGESAVYVGERLGWYRVSPTMLSTTWVDPAKQVQLARAQTMALAVILRSPRFAAIHPEVRRRMLLTIRHALMATLRTRDPRSVATVTARMLAGARDARRVVR
jgi:glycosyltransferase involved in cell wall biosynthesis